MTQPETKPTLSVRDRLVSDCVAEREEIVSNSVADRDGLVSDCVMERDRPVSSCVTEGDGLVSTVLWRGRSQCRGYRDGLVSDLSWRGQASLQLCHGEGQAGLCTAVSYDHHYTCYMYSVRILSYQLVEYNTHSVRVPPSVLVPSGT